MILIGEATGRLGHTHIARERLDKSLFLRDEVANSTLHFHGSGLVLSLFVSLHGYLMMHDVFHRAVVEAT